MISRFLPSSSDAADTAPVVIVPGLRDSGPGHWQTLWQHRLPRVARVRQERWDEPNLERWSTRVAEALDAAPGAWVVAHSFGCLASVHALATSGVSVRGLFLVAPADPDKFRVAERLPQTPLPVSGLIVGSLTDPWLSWHKAGQWAGRWQLPLACAGAAGHINVESGHGAWPEGWELFQRLRGQRRAGQRRTRTVPQWLPVAV